MALFKILKGNESGLSNQQKREGYAYFTTDENDFYIDISSSERKQLNANRAHYLKSKTISKNSVYDELYINDNEISLGRSKNESDYEGTGGRAGIKSIAVGSNASATGNYSSSFGSTTKASGINSHAVGSGSKATGEASSAEGSDTTASAFASHAEGITSIASADGAHAEGDRAIASGAHSHAGGQLSTTNEKKGSFVHGLSLVANAEYQTVFGKYSNATSTDAFVIGVGTSSENLSNGFSIDWDGKGSLKDTLLVGRDPSESLEVATKQYVDRIANSANDDKLFSFTTQLTTNASTIVFSSDDIDVNKCLVYYNGLLLILGENYAVVDEKTIQLNGWTAETGDFFVVTGKQGSDTSSAGKLNVGNVGSSVLPVYFNEGVPVQTSKNLDVSITGSAAKATNDSNDQNIASTYIKNVANKTGLSDSSIPQLIFTRGDNSTFTIETDYRVRQNKLSSTNSDIPLLLGTAGKTNTFIGEINYWSSLTYNPVSGKLNNANIDGGEWGNDPISGYCCFEAGTQVLMDLDGTTKNIEDIKPEEFAVAYDVKNGRKYMAIVKDVIIKDDVTDVAIVEFDNNTSLTMNAYHPIYTTDGWHSLTNYKNYDTLLVDDICKTDEGWSRITNIKRFTSMPIKMYTLNIVDIDEVEDNDKNDNFFANGIMVHNACEK